MLPVQAKIDHKNKFNSFFLKIIIYFKKRISNECHLLVFTIKFKNNLSLDLLVDQMSIFCL